MALTKALLYLTYAATIAILALIATRFYAIVCGLDYSWNYVGSNLMMLRDAILLVAIAFWFASTMYLVRELLVSSSKTYFLEALVKDVLRCAKKSVLILFIGVAILMLSSIALTRSFTYAQRLAPDVAVFFVLYVAVSRVIKVVERRF